MLSGAAAAFGPPLLGGMLIGAAVAMLLLLDGRVAGISGIVGGLVRPAVGDWSWRLLFVAGLLAGGLVAQAISPHAFERWTVTSLPVLLLGGGLVGIGTRLAGGCTSGHGVCGVSRLAPRSIVATLTFMGTAAAVVFIMRHAS
jgi:uncharacterized membrane protein YedE/YeeE